MKSPIALARSNGVWLALYDLDDALPIVQTEVDSVVLLQENLPVHTQYVLSSLLPSTESLYELDSLLDQVQ